MAPMAPPNNNSWNLAVPSRVRRSRRFDPHHGRAVFADLRVDERPNTPVGPPRSEEHTSELQSRFDLVCRLLLEKKKKIKKIHNVQRIKTKINKKKKKKRKKNIKTQ